ncbi:MAG: hypothetical protein HKN79_08820 [Flavobacteriales bacterium]|nr:hypothetical protein [Flavobacteriales bacterium]
MRSPAIFFHIGLGKTGTTFLQYRAFPKFKGIEYIQRTRYARAKEIINASSAQKFFISYECDQQLERVAKDWAKDYPQTTPIIVFRRHDSWIASQFRRFVKNCHVRRFDELLVPGTDQGLFNDQDLQYGAMVRMLDHLFDKKPIVLLYDDLRRDPEKFISFLAESMQCTIDIDEVDFSRKHSSYSEKQLKGLMATQRYIDLRKKVVLKNKVLEFFRKTAVNGTRYLILFLAGLMPDSWFTDGPLVKEEVLQAVRDHYQKDWEHILSIAQRVDNPVLIDP